jgi:hypothetical protein
VYRPGHLDDLAEWRPSTKELARQTTAIVLSHLEKVDGTPSVSQGEARQWWGECRGRAPTPRPLQVNVTRDLEDAYLLARGFCFLRPEDERVPMAELIDAHGPVRPRVAARSFVPSRSRRKSSAKCDRAATTILDAPVSAQENQIKPIVLELAAQLGKSESWVSRRLTGCVEFSDEEQQQIACELGYWVEWLFRIMQGADVVVLDLPAIADVNGPDDFVGLCGGEAVARVIGSPKRDKFNPWSLAAGMEVFLGGEGEAVDFLFSPVTVKEAVAEIFSPRGLGKSLWALFVGVFLAIAYRLGRSMELKDATCLTHKENCRGRQKEQGRGVDRSIGWRAPRWANG